MIGNARLSAVTLSLLVTFGARGVRADDAGSYSLPETEAGLYSAPDEEETRPARSGGLGTGVSLSYEDGLWGGSAWAQGLRVKVPLQPRWGMAIRPMIFTQTPVTWTMSDAPDAYRTDLGGRVELYGASAVFLDVVRVYVQGGPQLSYSTAAVTRAKPIVGGGGELGCELFLGRSAAVFAEIGGASGLQGGWATGSTVLAGITWYPWASSAPVKLVGSAK